MFLSHRTKSAAVNQYFFDLFRPLAEVQFCIDATQMAINVTRIERQLRSVDAFLGIYPFPREITAGAAPTRDALLAASRYFRLELDLATRAGCPALVFSDKAYGPALPVAASMMHMEFDTAEIVGGGRSPRAPAFERRFEDFLDMVTASMASRHIFDRQAIRPNLVGLLLPSGRGGYSSEHRHIITALLNRHNFPCIDIDWHARLDGDLLTRLGTLDMVVTDVGDWPSGVGLVPFLHGQFLPMIRLRKSAGASTDSAVMRTLFGGIDVGYVEDIVHWRTGVELDKKLASRLDVLTQATKRISTAREANEYFLSATRRKDMVFLSYAGEDAALASQLKKALDQRFSRVFDYKSLGSIRAGEPWLDEIFENIAESAIGIPLLSASYLASGHCMAEARYMIRRQTSGRMKMLPLMIDAATPGLPPWLSNLQWRPISKRPDLPQFVQLVEATIDHPATQRPKR